MTFLNEFPQYRLTARLMLAAAVGQKISPSSYAELLYKFIHQHLQKIFYTSIGKYFKFIGEMGTIWEVFYCLILDRAALSVHCVSFPHLSGGRPGDVQQAEAALQDGLRPHHRPFHAGHTAPPHQDPVRGRQGHHSAGGESTQHGILQSGSVHLRIKLHRVSIPVNGLMDFFAKCGQVLWPSPAGSRWCSSNHSQLAIFPAWPDLTRVMESAERVQCSPSPVNWSESKHGAHLNIGCENCEIGGERAAH